MKDAGRPKEFEKIQEHIDDIVFKKKTGEDDWPADVYAFIQELNQMYQSTLVETRAGHQLIIESLEQKIEVRDQRIQKLVEEITERKSIINLDSRRSSQEDKNNSADEERLEKILRSNENLSKQLESILQERDGIIYQSEIRAKEIQEKAKWKVVQLEKEGSNKLKQQQEQVNQILKSLANLRAKSNEDMKLILDDLGNLVHQIDQIQEKIVPSEQYENNKKSLPDEIEK